VTGLVLLLAGAALAQECDPPPEALGDLNAVISTIYDETSGVAEYCPEDLGRPLDMADADSRAAQLSADDRAAAAAMLVDAIGELGGEHTQATANAAGLIDALLGAAQADGDDLTALIDALLAIADGVEDPLLERQIAINLWRRGVDDPRVAALLEKFLPSEPDYDSIFADGRTDVSVMLRTGSDGFAYSDFEDAFARPGATLEKLDEDTHWRVTYQVAPDDPTLPTITYTIDIIKEGYSDKDTFVDMDNDDVQVTMFGDHSQLGTSLDRALGVAPDAADSTDFFWNDACKSKVFQSRLSQAYPQAHFVFTKDSEYFRDMPVSFERGLVALANRYDYDQMSRLVAAGSAWQSKNYVFPNDPQKLVFQDQDGDGIADAEDRIYDVAAAVENQGELASKAVHIANTYVGYSKAFVSHTARNDHDPEDWYRPDGLFDGEPGGPATHIETRTDAFGETKHFVAVNDELLEVDQTQRTALITADVATHWSGVIGWSERTTEIGAFLAGAAVYDVWGGRGWDSYVEQTMPGWELDHWDTAKFLDDHDFVTDEGIRKVMDHQKAQQE